MEYDFYDDLANWSFEEIEYVSENFTDWVYEDEIKRSVNEKSRVLDLGTAAGEKVLKKFPNCAEIVGTDFSSKMIESANKNLQLSGRKNISFRVMDNLNMDVPDNYFDVVTARHTVIDAVGIYKALKKGGKLILRGVDKLDCWNLKRLFGKGQAYYDLKSISLIDYEAIVDAGFKNVILIPIHVIEYYKTKDDLLALLVKTPILDDFSEENLGKAIERVSIDNDLFDEYVKQNSTEKGIRLVRRYYGIVAEKF